MPEAIDAALALFREERLQPCGMDVHEISEHVDVALGDHRGDLDAGHELDSRGGAAAAARAQPATVSWSVTPSTVTPAFAARSTSSSGDSARPKRSYGCEGRSIRRACGGTLPG